MGLEVFGTVEGFRAYRRGVRGLVAFVPTMGALHEGHASLVREARRMAGAEGVVAASIFVNPTQFGPHEDYARYPRTLEADLELLQANGCDAVFTPTPEVMYPPAGAGVVTVDPGVLGTVLEGAIRPGHFRGVCTVVAKLLGIVCPDKLVMGQKDYQQNAVLRAMIRDLNMPVEHVEVPTVREADGLAMSSRNRYLSPEERSRAVAIYRALAWARHAWAGGNRDADALGEGMRERIDAAGLATQYAVVAHADTLEVLAGVQGEVPAVLLVAAKLGGTRLIDNMRV